MAASETLGRAPVASKGPSRFQWAPDVPPVGVASAPAVSSIVSYSNMLVAASTLASPCPPPATPVASLTSLFDPSEQGTITSMVGPAGAVPTKSFLSTPSMLATPFSHHRPQLGVMAPCITTMLPFSRQGGKLPSSVMSDFGDDGLVEENNCTGHERVSSEQCVEHRTMTSTGGQGQVDAAGTSSATCVRGNEQIAKHMPSVSPSCSDQVGHPHGVASPPFYARGCGATAAAGQAHCGDFPSWWAQAATLPQVLATATDLRDIQTKSRYVYLMAGNAASIEYSHELGAANGIGTPIAPRRRKKSFICC